ncbi:hypothetical protein HOLleu_24386 [Holothuria leucospilota]|uniref:Uncharacterized protein n=1 Tax=Holothuria leucospilota TaxID=206669 RepID=A0A9Q1BWK0_HOLLE|nr:hypothetical protein HOLleu_24386 [Holothuria leucospilota]
MVNHSQLETVIMTQVMMITVPPYISIFVVRIAFTMLDGGTITADIHLSTVRTELIASIGIHFLAFAAT